MPIKVYNTKTGKEQYIHPDLIRDKQYMQSHSFVLKSQLEPTKVANLTAPEPIKEVPVQAQPTSKTTPKPKA